MIYIFLIWVGMVGAFSAQPPDTLTLQWCYKQLQENYPATEKIELEQQIVELRQKNLHTRFYPQPTLQAKASYQSDVTEVDFTPPSIPTPDLDKDQYSAEIQVRQLLYDGGQISAQKRVIKQEGAIQQSQVKVTLHELRKYIDRLYFNILRIQKNRASLRWTLKQLESQIQMVESQVEHGAMLKSNLNVLQAEKSQLQQKMISLVYDRKTAYEMMSKLLDVPIDTSVILKNPAPGNINYQFVGIKDRPEFELFQHRQRMLEARKEAVQSNRGPDLSAFGTAGYGRPGLNRFDPDFQPYYIVGLQLRWSFWDLLNADRELKQLQLEKRKIEADQKALTRRISSELQQFLEEREKLRRLIEKDQEIVEQRQQIVETSRSQLKNGVITSSDYLEELYEAKRARLQIELHKIELRFTNTKIATELNKSWTD